MTVFKRFQPPKAYLGIYVGVTIILMLASAVLISAIFDIGDAGKLSKILLGVLLIGVFGFTFGIGVVYKETVYPKINYVDYYVDKVEFIFAMVVNLVFVLFGIYIIARVLWPSTVPELI